MGQTFGAAAGKHQRSFSPAAGRRRLRGERGSGEQQGRQNQGSASPLASLGTDSYLYANVTATGLPEEEALHDVCDRRSVHWRQG